MTDEPERELTPEEDARIRSLLASARADEGVPDDVASRLDAVLAELVETRTAAPRRRRNTGRWLLGAAAASVATFALFHLPTSLPTSTTADSAGSGSQADAKSAPSSEAGAPSAPVRLSSDTFRRDVRRLLSQQSSRYSAASPGRTPSSDSPENGSDLARGTACQPSSPVAGVVQSRDVLLDGKPALLEVFGVETLATARIPAP